MANQFTNHKSPTCIENGNTVPESAENRKARRLQRAQWLRAAILGASDGLLSTTSLMLGIGAAQEDKRSMILSGLAGALAGAFSMAVGEFVSVSTQRDIESANSASNSSLPPPIQNSPAIKVEIVAPDKIVMSPLPAGIKIEEIEEDGGGTVLASPYQAAAASALSFLCGSSVPLLTAMCVRAKAVVARILVMMVVTSVASAVFGGVGACLGGSPAVRVSAVRVVIGGWIAMAVTYGLLKPFDSDD